MEIEQLIESFTSLGVVGVIAFFLFKNLLEEKKEDRELYKKSVEDFTQLSREYQKSITELSTYIKEREEVIDEIDDKVDELDDKVDSILVKLEAMATAE